MLEQNIDARQQALQFLIANFVAQGHPQEYAQHMATATIFQADLELRNAQIVSLLSGSIPLMQKYQLASSPLR